MTQDQAQQRTTDFMHALAASPVDACNISACRDGTGYVVTAWVATGSGDLGELAGAADLGAEHGFSLLGEAELVEGPQPPGEDRTPVQFALVEDRP